MGIQGHDGTGGALTLEGTSQCQPTAQGAVAAQAVAGGGDTVMPAESP